MRGEESSAGGEVTSEHVSAPGKVGLKRGCARFERRRSWLPQFRRLLRHVTELLARFSKLPDRLNYFQRSPESGRPFQIRPPATLTALLSIFLPSHRGHRIWRRPSHWRRDAQHIS